MLVFEGDTSDFAQSYTEYSIEVARYENGVKQAPFVIPAKELMGLSKEEELSVSIPSLELNLTVSNWLANSELVELKQTNGTTFTAISRATNPQAEANLAACKVKVTGPSINESALQLHATLIERNIPNSETSHIGIRLIKEIWPLPFSIKLNSSIGEYHPNTERPKYFESKVTKLNPQNPDSGDNYTIKMNEPLRHDGYTLYQARWMGNTTRPQSGFAVVNNPADQWPKYCLYLSILGLTAHFGFQLYNFILSRSRK